jgi:hypothetical protein
MKLTKDQTQKVILGAMLMIISVYGFYEFLIGPAMNSQDMAKQNIESLEPKIALAKGQIAKTKSLEAKLPDAKKLIAQVNSMIPEGAPVAWFPPRLTDYFKRQGIDKITARPNTEVVEKDLSGFKRLNWGVEIPRVDFGALARAVADLETGEPLLEIQGLDIEVSRDEVAVQRANLTINNLVRQ